MKQRFCNGMIHVIKPGENLYLLSRKYHVPLALILRANPYVDVYNLQPGQEVCIPMSRPIMPFPGVRSPMPREPEDVMENTLDEAVSEGREEINEEREQEREENEKIEEQKEMDFFVYITEEEESIASILDKTEMTLTEMLANNPLDGIILAKNVALNVPKKV